MFLPNQVSTQTNHLVHVVTKHSHYLFKANQLVTGVPVMCSRYNFTLRLALCLWVIQTKIRSIIFYSCCTNVVYSTYVFLKQSTSCLYLL